MTEGGHPVSRSQSNHLQDHDAAAGISRRARKAGRCRLLSRHAHASNSRAVNVHRRYAGALWAVAVKISVVSNHPVRPVDQQIRPIVDLQTADGSCGTRSVELSSVGNFSSEHLEFRE